MKVLSSILLLLLAAGCASYHDGNRKGIFLRNDTPAPAYAVRNSDLDAREKFNAKIKEKITRKDT